MDVKKLKEIEDFYKDLKYKLDAGEISGDDMKAELKKMMIRDDDNRYWMIGNKSGGWYVYDGSTWNAADPYSQEKAAAVGRAEAAGTSGAVCPAVEEEKKAEPEPQVLCKFCQSRIQKHDVYCNFCGGQQKGTDKTIRAQNT